MYSKPNDNSLISIVLPVRNAGNTLSSCLQSLLFQHYTDIEIIAVDDFSRDNTMQVLREFSKVDKRLKIIRNVKPYGLAISLMRGVRKAKGQYLVLMDPTDSVTPQKLTKQLHTLQSDNRIVAVNSQSILVNKEGKRIGRTSFDEEASLASHLPHRPSALFSGIMIDRMRIPKDLLEFQYDTLHLIGADTISKLLHFGKIINLSELLHTHMDPFAMDFSLPLKLASTFKLWIQAKAENRAVPSFSRILLGML